MIIDFNQFHGNSSETKRTKLFSLFPFSDKPGPPENLQVSDVHAEHCKLSWNPPSDDGNGEITGEPVNIS